MKKKTIILITLLIAALLLLIGCGSKDKHSKALLLHLTFDEGQGLVVKDAAGKVPDTEMNYTFAHATYMDSQEPQWRK